MNTLPDTVRLGLISDTHGLLRPQAAEFLRGCDHVIHAGDIGKPQVLEGQRPIAPLSAIRGNIDTGAWAETLPDTLDLELAGLRIHVLHDLGQLDRDPAAAGIRVVVSGHSHKPRLDEHDGVLYINPGSAGPRRFSLPVSVGELLVAGDLLTPRLVRLQPSG
jgi:putative phosphoesterase